MFQPPLNISNKQQQQQSIIIKQTLIKTQTSLNKKLSPMSKIPLLLLLLFLLPFTTPTPTPYLSPTTLPQNFHSMLTTFKIYIYTPLTPFNYTSTPFSLFHNSLLHSSFLTQDPTQAHFFFIPLPPSISTRSLARVIKHIRANYPFWDKSLGADHFFISSAGIDYSSDRNLLELKKNSVQVSIFPVKTGFFVPHKDVTLPPVQFLGQRLNLFHKKEKPFLGFLKLGEGIDLGLGIVNEMKEMDEFLVGNDLSDFGASKFCLFVYNSDVDWIVDAMSNGCVPVLIVDRAIQDLPLMDVLKWEDLVLVVKVESGVRLKEVLSGVSEERYRKMKALGVEASKHLRWKVETEEGVGTDVETCGAFEMVMYQLWLRRHVIRYERRDVV